MRIAPLAASGRVAVDVRAASLADLGFGEARVRDDAAGVEFDLDLLACFANLHAAADKSRGNRVAIGVQRHVAFGIDDALMQPVDFRNPRRQWFQVQSFDRDRVRAEPREYVSCTSY